LHKQKPIFHLNDHFKLPGSLKRKYAFIFASYNNPCGAAGIPGNLMVRQRILQISLLNSPQNGKLAAPPTIILMIGLMNGARR